MRIGLRGALLALGMAAFACDGDDEPSPKGLCGLESCPDACKQVVIGLCDVREHACLQRVLDAVSCVRGTSGTLPELRTLTEEEYLAEGLDAGRDGGDLDEDAGAEVTADAGPPTDDALRPALALLGLVMPSVTMETLANEHVGRLGGFYESSRNTVTLIDRGMPLDGPYAQSLMAHELVHVLQHQAAEPPQLDSVDLDAWSAFGCLKEGDADFYGARAAALLQGVQLGATDWDVLLARELKYARRSVLGAGSPFYAAWLLRYPVGTRYLADAHAHGGNQEVLRMYESPLPSTVQWMVGYDGNTSGKVALSLPLECARAVTPAGYARSSEYKLGALLLYALLGHHLRDEGRFESEEQWRNALHWRNDRLTILLGPAGELAVSYRVRLDDAALAEALAERLRDAVSGVRVHHAGEELELLGAEDLALLDAWLEHAEECPPAE